MVATDNKAPTEAGPEKENTATVVRDDPENGTTEVGPQGDTANDGKADRVPKKRKRQLGVSGRKSSRK